MIHLLTALTFSLFIFAIHSLSEPRTAYKGNIIAIMAMIIILSLHIQKIPSQYFIWTISTLAIGAIIGLFISYKINMSRLPQMIALFNGFGGFAAGLIGMTEFSNNQQNLLILTIIAIGFITLSGSITAFLKLNGTKHFANTQILNILNFIIFIFILVSGYFAYYGYPNYIISFCLLTILWGFFFTLPIGSADMPIVISILNAFSGWSTVFVGFSLNNILLIITGSLIGTSGFILSYIMTKMMHRNLLRIIFPTPKQITANEDTSEKQIHIGTPRDAAFLMENATKIIIVPGYGMAVSNAQHELKNMIKILQTNYHVTVKIAIHPVAGRMPGHMNVLLAEADINPDDVFELKDINQEFQTTDVVYIIGANDITNPVAKTKTDSPIYQMPILEVEQAKHILFVKRSLAPGYSGIDNPLFYRDNTLMLLGDAKEITKQIVTALE